MSDSIFTKIIKGEIPAYKIYEDDKTLAFLDIHPAQTGHTLVVPKLQVAEFQDMSEADYQALMASVKKVAQRLKEVLKPKRVGLHVEGFDVPHVHVHVLPINHGFKDFTPPNPNLEPNHDALAELAKTLAF
ncbi:MAG: HIT family protein [Candidatus Saccharimonadales bacterium]